MLIKSALQFFHCLQKSRVNKFINVTTYQLMSTKTTVYSWQFVYVRNSSIIPHVKCICCRGNSSFSSQHQQQKTDSREKKRTGRSGRFNFSKYVYYYTGLPIIMIGLSFAFIPFYRMLCETTSFTGITQITENLEKIAHMEKVEDRLIRVQFNADVPSSMQWKFKPLQDEIYVYPGETALAFFTAKNPTDRPIVGLSTYNLTPFQAAYYFNKIQCFCFDEQILNPGEEVDLPVFFYIDPDFASDPLLEDLEELLLSYTFFESKTGLVLPSPFDPNNRPLAEKSGQQKQDSIVGREEEMATRPIAIQQTQ